MSEVHFVALIVAGLCAMMLLQAMPPDWFVTILLAAFNLLNLLMLFGNGWQAWKKDPRFGASLDGVINDDTGIEIKCPQRMYKPILEFLERKERGYVFSRDCHQ